MKSWDRQLGRAFAMIKLSSANGLEVDRRRYSVTVPTPFGAVRGAHAHTCWANRRGQVDDS